MRISLVDWAVVVESMRSLTGQSINPSFLRIHQRPYPRGRQWQLAWLDPEAGERIGDRIGHHAAGRDDAALARSLGAERIDRRRLHFQRDAPQVGEIACGR